MSNWTDLLLAPDASILDAMRVLDSSAMQIVLVADPGGRLLGTLTDGDVRRALLRGGGQETPVAEVMNRAPTTVGASTPRGVCMGILTARQLRHLPVVDDGNRLTGLVSLDDFIRHENRVVLMAGGKGTRLRPITENKPKPMIEVGGKPILQTTIETMISQGFWRFTLSVGYRADDIVSYFGDGTRFGADITYVRENGALGTAGALSLLNPRPAAPFVVMNGDIITTANIADLVSFHETREVRATMCVREYAIQIPYGVVTAHDGILARIDEKPWNRCLVSAGIYVLEPSSLDHVRPDERIDMPDLLQRLTQGDAPVATYMLNDYWIDIGRPEELDRAEADYPTIFNDDAAART